MSTASTCAGGDAVAVLRVERHCDAGQAESRRDLVEHLGDDREPGDDALRASHEVSAAGASGPIVASRGHVPARVSPEVLVEGAADDVGDPRGVEVELRDVVHGDQPNLVRRGRRHAP